MSKFPKEAEAVRKYIRDNVERPDILPMNNPLDSKLHWVGGKCPLGLIPGVINGAPSTIECFKNHENLPFEQNDMIDFYLWWDSQTDPQYAVDQVWGK